MLGSIRYFPLVRYCILPSTVWCGAVHTFSRTFRSIGKLIFYAGGEFKILHRQFFDGNTLQNSFLNTKVVCLFFHKKK